MHSAPMPVSPGIEPSRFGMPDCNGCGTSEKQIPAEIARLREGVMFNRKLIDELAQRLSPLIPNVPTGETNSKPEPMPAVSPLADDIRSIGLSVHQANATLQFLLGKIEI